MVVKEPWNSPDLAIRGEDSLSQHRPETSPSAVRDLKVGKLCGQQGLDILGVCGEELSPPKKPMLEGWAALLLEYGKKFLGQHVFLG